MKVLKPNVAKRGGEIPVVMQNAITKEILMLAYLNIEAYLHMLKTGLATFFSTSRNEMWVKGATSGNTFKVVDIHVDCDGDAMLVLVVPLGGKAACHTGAETCFYRSVLGRGVGVRAPETGEKEKLEEMEAEMHPDLEKFARTSSPPEQDILLWDLGVLESRLKGRAKAPATESYTRQLLDKGTAKCAKKFGEEAVETAMAAVAESDERLIAECADVTYHLLVLLMSRGLTFEMVEKELRRREAQSGLAEKASRKPT